MKEEEKVAAEKEAVKMHVISVHLYIANFIKLL